MFQQVDSIIQQIQPQEAPAAAVQDRPSLPAQWAQWTTEIRVAAGNALAQDGGL